MNIAARLARRDLRGGWSGLGLLFVCLALSLAGLSAVTSLASAVDSAIAANGRDLLGGDLALQIAGRDAAPDEAAAIAGLGRAAKATMVRAMLVAPSGDSALAELSGIDGSWPAAGKIDFAAGRRPRGAEVAIDRRLATRLGLASGAEVQIGGKPFRVSGIIAAMPGGGFALAPPALVDEAGLARTGLIQPGSLTTTSFRIALPAGADPDAAAKQFEQRFAAAGWRITTRAEAASGTRRLVDNLGNLLSLLALTALAIGGLGINSAASAFAASREPRIAMMKLVGAPRSTLLAMLAIEVGAVAAAAMALGLAVGAATPSLVGALTEGLLPVAPDPRPQWSALALSGAFGALAVAASSWGPLAKAIATRPASLLRGELGTAAAYPRWPAVLFAGLGIALATLTSSRPLTIAIAIAVLAALALLFAGAGAGIRRAARRLRHRGGVLTRLGLGALDRPGAATVRLSVSLGLGISLLVALAAGASSLLTTLRGQTEARAPALFMLDVPKEREAELRGIAAKALSGGELRMLPSLRGPVTAIKGVPVSEMREIPEGAWILRGDRGLTFMAELPAGNRIVAGEWWPADYRGPPLVSLDVDAARALGLKVGDRMTVTVLGRPIDARIASLRQIDWRSLGFNFAIIFDPNSLKDAPFTWMASAAPARGGSSDRFEREVTRTLPMASQVRVAEVVAEVERLLAALGGAIRLGAGFALLVGVVVLAGSVVATRSARAREIVLLRLVGATRRQATLAQGLEFVVIAGGAGLVALAAGLAIAWAVCRFVFEIPFDPDWAAAIGIPFAGAAAASLAALAAAQGALRARPAVGLRNHTR